MFQTLFIYFLTKTADSPLSVTYSAASLINNELFAPNWLLVELLEKNVKYVKM